MVDISNSELTVSTGKQILAGISSVLIPVFTFLSPIKVVLLLVVITILLDMFFGIWRSRKVDGSGIESRRLWRTVEKLFCAVVLVILLYAVDTHVASLALHKIVAGFIIGCDLWSILENMAEITEHPVFKIIRKYMSKRVKETTGLVIEEELKEIEETAKNK